MNPRDFQQFAEQLARNSAPTPAECRSAISRAYYAGFNVGAELLRSPGFPIGRGGAVHGEVRHCLANSGNPSVAAAASEMAYLHTQRNRADYHLDRTDLERRTEMLAVVRKAADVIRSLDAAFAGPERPKIHAAIRSWRQANGYP